MLSLVAAAVLLQSPDLAADPRLVAPVTCKVAALPLSKVLETIGQAGKLTLSAPKPFDQDLIALRVEGSRLSDVMARLANKLRLSWRKTETGYELYQSPDQKDQAQEDLAAQRIGRLKELRAQQQAKFKLPRPDFDELERRLAAEAAEPLPDFNKDRKAYLERGKVMEQLRLEGDPSLWFASGAIAALTDDQLAELLDAGSITLVKNPNRLQHRLASQAQNDATAWARRNGTFTDVRGSLRLRMVNAGQVKVTVAIAAEISLGANEFWLELVDPVLPANSRESKGTGLDRDLGIEGYLGMRYGMPNSRMPSERVIGQIVEARVSPEKREPLEVMAAAGLIEIAEESGYNLLAVLSDDMIALGNQSALPKNGRNMLAQFCDDVRAEYDEDNGWLEIAPRELALSRAKQFPRKYFRQVASATKGGKILPLSTVARIVGECTDLQLEGRFFRDYLTEAAARREFSLLDTWGDTSALRFWDALAEDEIRALMSGGLQIGRINPIAKRLLWRAASLGGTTISGSSPFNRVFRTPQGNDPTAVFPNGFPFDEVLEAHTDTTECVLSHFQPAKKQIPVSLSVEQFAAFADPNKADMSDIRFGSSHRVAVVIDRLTWFAEFREDRYDFSKPPISWSAVPDAIKTRYEEAKKNPRNNMGIIIR